MAAKGAQVACGEGVGSFLAREVFLLHARQPLGKVFVLRFQRSRRAGLCELFVTFGDGDFRLGDLLLKLLRAQTAKGARPGVLGLERAAGLASAISFCAQAE